MEKLTTAEAKSLIDMLKKYTEKKRLEFPHMGDKLQFNVVGDEKSDKFTVHIYRNRIVPDSATFQGRTEGDNIPLLRLDVNPTARHMNPNGEKIYGTHLHIYNDEYDMGFAMPFDTENKDLFELCFTFFKEFNIIDGESFIHCQYSMDN